MTALEGSGKWLGAIVLGMVLAAGGIGALIALLDAGYYFQEWLRWIS